MDTKSILSPFHRRGWVMAVDAGEGISGSGAGTSKWSEIEEEVADNFGGEGKRINPEDVGLRNRSSSSVKEEAGEMVRLVRKGEFSVVLDEEEVNEAQDGWARTAVVE